MPTCSVLGCNSRTSRKSKNQLNKEEQKKITFHSFPKDPKKRDLWMKAIKRKEWNTSNRNVICSEHFEDDCFNKTFNIMQLHGYAVPTIFAEVRKRFRREMYTSSSPVNNAPLSTFINENSSVIKIEDALPSTSVAVTSLFSMNLEDALLTTSAGAASTSLTNLEDPLACISATAVSSSAIHLKDLPYPSKTVPVFKNLDAKSNISKKTKMISTTSFSAIRNCTRSVSPTTALILKTMRTAMLKFRKNIKRMQQKNRRQRKQIAEMKSVIQIL